MVDVKRVALGVPVTGEAAGGEMQEFWAAWLVDDGDPTDTRSWDALASLVAHAEAKAREEGWREGIEAAALVCREQDCADSSVDHKTGRGAAYELEQRIRALGAGEGKR